MGAGLPVGVGPSRVVLVMTLSWNCPVQVSIWHYNDTTLNKRRLEMTKKQIAQLIAIITLATLGLISLVVVFDLHTVDIIQGRYVFTGLSFEDGSFIFDIKGNTIAGCIPWELCSENGLH